jgi:hypothetical protein
VTLVADVMFVNGLPFLVTSLRGISLVTIEYLKSRTAKRLVDTLERVIRIYSKARFIVQTALMDMEFKQLKDKLPNVTLNTTAAREHVGEVKRKIRLVKERARSTMSILPYKLLPKLVIVELMHFCVMWMNSFPAKSGISEKWSPREIVSRHKLDAKMHCKVPFGAYCEVHVDPDITNTMEPRTKWGICLGPTGNMQGSYKFLSLSTGKKVTRRKFTEMPMTDSVINMVDSLGKKERCKNGLSFKNSKGKEYTFDNEDEYEMIAEAKIPAPFPDIAAEAPGILTMDFEINLYDPCVANKHVDKKQMTVRWHIDDLMIRHVDKGEILEFVRCIKEIYGDNLVENVGKVHDYLGMTFDYAFGGEGRINMCKYLSSIIADFPEQITGVSATPAADHLFKVRENGKKLSKEQADAFHHTVYQLLFATNRAS